MPAEIKITVSDTGATQVSGQIDNPLIAYGIIEMGKQALIDHYRKLADRLVQPVTIAPTFKLD